MAEMIEYVSRDFTAKCRKAADSKTAFCIRIPGSHRKADAMRRTLRHLTQPRRDQYPLLLDMVDKFRLLKLHAGMSHALAARWHFAFYEDDQGFEIYLTPRR